MTNDRSEADGVKSADEHKGIRQAQTSHTKQNMRLNFKKKIN